MLVLDHVYAGYRGKEVLHGISLHVPEGKIAVLLGTNGAGKTTTLSTIVGLVKRMRGKVLFADQDIGGNDVADNIRSGIALVPEGARVFSDFSVQDNLKLGAFSVKNPRIIQERMERALDTFPILGQRMRQRAGTLSGGERQMLAVGRALMTHPKLLLFDEPFLGLAPVVVDTVIEAVANINRLQGVTCLVVEQNTQILEIADLAFVMQLGEVVITEDNPNTLLSDDRLKNCFIA